MDISSAKSALPDPKVARHYAFGEVAVVLLAFVVMALVLDSGGLLTWANRLPIGPAQAFWLQVLTPVDRALEQVRLTAPRARLVALSDRLSARWAIPAEDDVRIASEEPMPTASPSPLGAEVDGPLGPLRPAAGDEVVLPTAGFAPPSIGPTQVTILLVGDSMMQIGIAPGIVQAFAGDPRVRIVRQTQIGTGLSRPDVFDWPAELAPMLVREKPRFVVATFGGNDAQDMRLGEQAIPFGTFTWDATYQDRVHAFMDELAHGGAEVLWIGLPPMRADDFNERVSKLDDLVVAAMHGEPRVNFLDATSLVTGPDRAYTTYLPAPGGGLVQVRQQDGIHLSSAGGELVAARVVAWITARAAELGGAALNAPAPPGLAQSRAPGG
jgi:uncharacterized protein